MLVTKKNPTNWVDGEPEDARFFTTPDELENFHRTSQFGIKGTFGLMVVIRTEKGILPIHKSTVSIMVDDPERKLSDGTTAFPHAINRINAAFAKSGTRFAVTKRICRGGCQCVSQYSSLADFDKFFR